MHILFIEDIIHLFNTRNSENDNNYLQDTTININPCLQDQPNSLLYTDNFILEKNVSNEFISSNLNIFIPDLVHMTFKDIICNNLNIKNAIQKRGKNSEIGVMQIIIYLYIRNKGYNLLRYFQPINLYSVYHNIYTNNKNNKSLSIYNIYKRHKHFNRSKDMKIAELLFRFKEDGIEDDYIHDERVSIVAVVDDDAYTFIKMEYVKNLSKKNDRKDYKFNR